MSTTDDYIKNGGMTGYFKRLWEEQVIQASEDEGHIFRGVVEAMQRGEHERASKLLVAILRDVPDNDPLGIVAWYLLKLPAIQMAINEAADRIDDEAFQETLPPKIMQWGTMEAQLRVVEPDVKSGRGYRKNQAKNASHNRPVKNDYNESLDDVISKLYNDHPDEKPSDVWPHFKTAIKDWSGSECKEARPDIKKRDSWLYNFTRKDGAPDTITYQSFRKKLKNGT